MKQLLTFAALSAFASLGLTGCGTSVGVDNPHNSTGRYATGTLNTKYAASTEDYIENVNNATKKALDDLRYFRTGESPRQNGITHYARTHGDIEITVDLTKRVEEGKDGQKTQWVYVSVRYGTWGNCEKSQQIISKISANLKYSEPPSKNRPQRPVFLRPNETQEEASPGRNDTQCAANRIQHGQLLRQKLPHHHSR